jgi:hypothetical protein
LKPKEDIEKRIKNVNIVIDSESNKRVFSNILQAFQKSTAKDLAPTDKPNIWRIIFRNPITKLAAAAVIIIAISFFIVHQNPSEKADTTIISKVPKSPAEMQAILSLSIAYRRGGIEAVDRQCQKAIEMLGPRPPEITIQQILTEFNGT